MPEKNKDIKLVIGIFNEAKQDTKWKDIQTFDTKKEGYIAFKDLCKKCVTYSYDELIEIYDSPRLDIELLEGDTMIKWIGIYEREDEEEEKSE